MLRVTCALLSSFILLVPLASIVSAKESGPPRLACSTARAELRQATFQLEMGSARLRNGKACLMFPGEPCEWDVALTRAERWGQNSQFLIAIVNANHLLGSGAWDSVFLYVCNDGVMTPVLAERSLYGIRVKLGSANDLWMTTGVWSKDDPTCCASSELQRHLVWDAERGRFVVKDSSRRSFKASKPLAVAGAQTPTSEVDPRIQQLVASISEARLRMLVTTLAGFGTRETLSTTSSTTRGIGAARQWIFDEFVRSSPRLQVSFDTYNVAAQRRMTRSTELRNVIAVLPGRSSRRIYITGHYDSLNLGETTRATTGRATNPQERADFNHEADAPGANDNASGTALTMELARVFAESGITFDATMVFACWAGEEQGLVGSAVHAKRLVSEKALVEAMFNNDIVGNVRGGNGRVDSASVRVFSAGPEDSMSRSLARYIARVASLYVPSHRIRLMAREDRFGRNSDHASFTASGFPAIVFRESNENLERQHSVRDTLDGVDFTYLAQNARVNAASAASLALAPASPVVTMTTTGAPRISRGPSGYDANLQWAASPGATGYRIYWRETWANDWQRSQTVGDVTRFVLQNMQIDDFVFGVAAIGPSGHESLVRAYVSPPRTASEIKLVK